MRVPRKIVAVVGPLPAKLEIIATNRHDPRIVAICLEYLIAKSEEGRVRKTIIFQEDCLFNVTEHPIDSAGDPVSTAHVRIGVVRVQVAAPIGTSDNFSDCFTTFSFSGPFVARAVGDDE